MITRKANIEILETPDDKLQSDSERWAKSHIESELCQNQPIPVDEDEVIFTMIQHNCYDEDDDDDNVDNRNTEQKLLKKLIENWDELSLSEKEVAHYLNGTSPTLESLGHLSSNQFNNNELISTKAITKEWLKYVREIINSKPEITTV